MPEETDAVTGNEILQEEGRADPQAPVAYRAAVSAADGSTKPAAGSVLWLSNPGYRTTARVYVDATGSPAACTLRPYVRSGGATGNVGSLPAQTLNAAPNYDACFDVGCDGDDLAVLVESLSGGTSPTVTIAVSWR